MALVLLVTTAETVMPPIDLRVPTSLSNCHSCLPNEVTHCPRKNICQTDFSKCACMSVHTCVCLCICVHMYVEHEHNSRVLYTFETGSLKLTIEAAQWAPDTQSLLLSIAEIMHTSHHTKICSRALFPRPWIHDSKWIYQAEVLRTLWERIFKMCAPTPIKRVESWGGQGFLGQ